MICALQESTADELEEAYRGQIWDPSRGHTEQQKQGITAARLELRTLTHEAKACSRPCILSLLQHSIPAGYSGTYDWQCSPMEPSSGPECEDAVRALGLTITAYVLCRVHMLSLWAAMRCTCASTATPPGSQGAPVLPTTQCALPICQLPVKLSPCTALAQVLCLCKRLHHSTM